MFRKIRNSNTGIVMKLAGFLLVILLSFLSNEGFAQVQSIYHDGWIDFNKNGKKDVFEDPSQPVEKRVADLLSQMTLNEKTCQLATLYGFGRVLKDELPTAQWKNEVWKDGIANIDEDLNTVAYRPETNTQYSFPFSKHADAINKIQKWFIEETRLGIPVDFTNEGVHGLCHDRATPFPAPISIGSTWDKKLVYQAGVIEGREAKALGYTNVYAPILDVSRDPRWGRVVETYGENPYLIAELGKQMTLGMQEQGIASTLKHFAVYSVPKGGRDGRARTDPHVAPRELYYMYLYPFRRVIEEAHAMGVMSSYNDWDGEPITGSHFFLTELLRQQFGFNGYVVSDSRAVEYLVTKHHVAADIKDAAIQALEAGLNVRTAVDSPTNYIYPIRDAVKEGKISLQTLDSRVADVLRVKFELGLFDCPYVDPSIADSIVHTPKDEAFALRMNEESLVLLKNENKILPLDVQKTKRVLVTGPLAAEVNYMTSRYGPSNNPVVTVLDGIKNLMGNKIKVEYAKGCAVTDSTWPETEILPTALTKDEQPLITEAVKKAKKSDVIIAVMGEDMNEVGEGLSRTSLNLPGKQETFLEELYKTGKPIILVLINGQPLTINWADKYLPGILEAGFPGPQGGTAIANALFGLYNPGGKLSITFPKTVGQIEYNFPFKAGSQEGQGGGDKVNYGKTRILNALYPFGYGLSYTTFNYSNLVVTPEKQHRNGDINVSVDVQNTGDREGDEVVQLYIKDEVSSVVTYEYDLRGFERIHLLPGEKQTVHFVLHPDDLSFMDKNKHWTVEPGKFKAMVGSSSVDIRLEKEFVIENDD
jgi:beta-glucosidase